MPIRRPTGRRSWSPLNAELELAGPNGRRRVAAKDFFVDIMTTALEPGEVLVAIHIPRPNPGCAVPISQDPPSRERLCRGRCRRRAAADTTASFRKRTIGITGATGHAFAADAASAHLIGKPLSSENIAHGRTACQRTGRMSVGWLCVGGLSQASRQDRGHPGVGVAEWCLIGQAPPLFVIGRSRSIPRPSKSRACDVRQTPRTLRALRRSAGARETTRLLG